eukprot:Selendium_serpulae@DN5276_c0_g1_i2.p1
MFNTATKPSYQGDSGTEPTWQSTVNFTDARLKGESLEQHYWDGNLPKSSSLTVPYREVTAFVGLAESLEVPVGVTLRQPGKPVMLLCGTEAERESDALASVYGDNRSPIPFRPLDAFYSVPTSGHDQDNTKAWGGVLWLNSKRLVGEELIESDIEEDVDIQLTEIPVAKRPRKPSAAEHDQTELSHRMADEEARTTSQNNTQSSEAPPLRSVDRNVSVQGNNAA